jgi:hypothetical protein
MSDKGNVYYCKWLKSDGTTYVGWMEKRPKLRAEGQTKDEMARSLGEIVGEYHDDHEACLQFDPPLNSGEGNDPLFVDRLVEIGWNASLFCRASAESAFAGGRCKRCGGGVGRRTLLPLILASLSQGSDGAQSWVSNSPPPTRGDPACFMILSARFLDLLTKKERDQFEARPTERISHSRRKFFEVIPKSFIPTVGIRSLEIHGWRCEVCKRRCISHGKALGWGIRAVCRTDLPVPLPACFFVGTPIDYGFVVSEARWNQLRGERYSRKILRSGLAVVEENDCLRKPFLPTLDELADFRRKHGYIAAYKRPKK